MCIIDRVCVCVCVCVCKWVCACLFILSCWITCITLHCKLHILYHDVMWFVSKQDDVILTSFSLARNSRGS